MCATALEFDSTQFKRLFWALGDFAEADLGPLLDAMRTIHIEAGSPLMAPGRDNDSLYLICSGRVRVTVDTERVAVKLGEFGAGQWIGEMAMIDPAPATATVTAIEDCTVLVLSHDRFMALRRTHPAMTSVLLQAFSNQLIERLRRTVEHLDTGSGTPKEHQNWLVEATRRLLGIAAQAAT